MARLARLNQPKMPQRIHVTRSSDVMGLIHKDELESRGIKFRHAIARIDASYRGNSDVCKATRMEVSHFDLDGFVWICVAAVSGCLFDQLSPVDKDECLVGAILPWLDTIDELSEDHLCNALSILRGINEETF